MEKINLLVAMVKIVACYAVVSIHFGGTLPFAGLAVPMFMFFSFYYTKSWGGTPWNRLRRLALPFVFWGVLPFAVHSVFVRRFDGMRLFSQLTAGAPENHPLYFLLLMMMYSVVVHFVSKLSRRENLCLVALVVACLILQYSGLNATMWKSLPLPKYHEILLGRFCELMPAALAGRIFHKCREKVTGDAWSAIGAGRVVAFLLLSVFRFDSRLAGYDYSGVTLFLGACGLCGLAVLAGERLSASERIAKVILAISGATAGIYYMHQFVGHVFAGYLLPKSYPVLLITPLIFVLCFAVALVLRRWRFTSWMVK